MADFIEAMTGLVAVLMIPAIFWIIFHYRSVTKRGGSITKEEVKQLDELMDIADNMAERIKTLESILDDETPEWRERVREQQGEE